MHRPNYHRRPSPVRLCLEPLESREVPAGNVTASVVHYWWGSVLEVQGDSADNQVVLRGTANPGEVKVIGHDTAINGGTEPLVFANISQLKVWGQDGCDSIRGVNLDLPHIALNGGAGDDAVEVRGLAPSSDFVFVGMYGEEGDDELLFTQASVGAIALTMETDSTDTLPGHNTLTVSHVEVAGHFDFTTQGSFDPAAPGDHITIRDIDWSFGNPAFGDFAGYWYVNGSAGPDDFRVSNLDFHWVAEMTLFADLFIGSFEGDDTLDVSNVTLEAHVTATSGEIWYVGPVNQVFLTFQADTIRARHLDLTAGGHFLDESDGTTYNTGGGLALVGTYVDARHVRVHTNGFGGLNLISMEYVDGLAVDDCIALNDVSVTSWNEITGDLYVDTAAGNDDVSIKNTSTDSLYAFLGEGDDVLLLRHVDVLFSMLDGGLGADLIKLGHTTEPMDYVGFETVE